MRTIKIFTVIFLLGMELILNAQPNQISSAELFTLEGTKIDATSILNNNMTTILVFWKTTDANSVEEIEFAAELWKEQIKLKRVRLIAICIDCSGSVQHVKPFILGHGIDAEVYIDKNGNFKRQMCISDGPTAVVFDEDMAFYYRENGYCYMNEMLIENKVNQSLLHFVNK
ncbi:MAG: hypothetical protein KQI35_10635 [Bacteroidetes bacterium]|nr:hypothetical protein [Bacteroidota bacterium]